jgi:hypothetical protein
MNAALIIAYKRSDCLLGIVDSLFKGGIKKIYVAIDGLKIEEEESDLVERVLKQACATYGIELLIWKRSSNLGLAASVISGADWFFGLEAEGIIVEDDLVFSPDFVHFAKVSLEIMKHEPDILMVSGNQFSDNFRLNNIATITNYPMVWGWATSANRWELMRKLVLSERLDWSKSTAKLAVRNYWASGQYRARLGYMNSWAVPLAAAMRAGNFFCILPPANLVSNVGTDSSATHTIKISANMHAVVRKLDPEVNFQLDSDGLRFNNLWLEKFHFGIRKRNILSLYKARIKSKFEKPRLNSLTERVDEIKLPI